MIGGICVRNNYLYPSSIHNYSVLEVIIIYRKEKRAYVRGKLGKTHNEISRNNFSKELFEIFFGKVKSCWQYLKIIVVKHQFEMENISLVYSK